MNLLLVRWALDLLATRGVLRRLCRAGAYRHGATAFCCTLLLRRSSRLVLTARNESEGALRGGPRIETLYDVALHSTVTEVDMALVTNLPIHQRANQVGRIMPERSDVARMRSSSHVALKHGVT